MLQQLLRRLVFDVPLLTEYCKMPLRVSNSFFLLLTCFVFTLSSLIVFLAFKFCVSCLADKVHCLKFYILISFLLFYLTFSNFVCVCVVSS